MNLWKQEMTSICSQFSVDVFIKTYKEYVILLWYKTKKEYTLQMLAKKINYSIIILFIVFIIRTFFWNKAIEIKKDSHDENIITGILLEWPSWQKTRSNRISIMWENKSYLKWWIYDMNDKKTKERFKKYSKNTPVKIIVENNKYKQDSDLFLDLSKEFFNLPITIYPDKNLKINNTHAKAFVWEKRWVIQTANLNRSSFYNNREHFFFWTNDIIKKNLLDLFTLDEKTITTNIRNKNEYNNLSKTFSPYLVVCPLDCRSKIETLLLEAKKSIWISAQYITDEDIINILYNKKNIDLRILTNNMESNNKLSEKLWKNYVYFEKDWKYNHDKMIIIDNNKLLVWSINLSTNSLDHNREISIITTDKSIIKKELQLFEWLIN